MHSERILVVLERDARDDADLSSHSSRSCMPHGTGGVGRGVQVYRILGIGSVMCHVLFQYIIISSNSSSSTVVFL